MVTVSKSIIQNDGQDTGQGAVMAGTWQIATDNPDYTDLLRNGWALI